MVNNSFYYFILFLFVPSLLLQIVKNKERKEVMHMKPCASASKHEDQKEAFSFWFSLSSWVCWIIKRQKLRGREGDVLLGFNFQKTKSRDHERWKRTYHSLKRFPWFQSRWTMTNIIQMYHYYFFLPFLGPYILSNFHWWVEKWTWWSLSKW